MGKKKATEKAIKVHKDLEGFDLKVNEFGEIVTNLNVDKLNEFLNKNLDDKKLREREDPLDEEE